MICIKWLGGIAAYSNSLVGRRSKITHLINTRSFRILPCTHPFLTHSLNLPYKKKKHQMMAMASPSWGSTSPPAASSQASSNNVPRDCHPEILHAQRAKIPGRTVWWGVKGMIHKLGEHEKKVSMGRWRQEGLPPNSKFVEALCFSFMSVRCKSKGEPVSSDSIFKSKV